MLTDLRFYKSLIFITIVFTEFCDLEFFVFKVFTWILFKIYLK